MSMLRSMCRATVCAASLLIVLPVLAAEPSFHNPLVRQRADPQVMLQDDGYYYLAATVPEYDRIELRRARTLDGLGAGEAKVVWRKHASGEMGAHIWAPELHRIDGKWYLYFTAGRADKIWEIRLYVLENASPDPLKGEWVERGQLKTGWESFALDATTFAHRGQRFLVWTQRAPDGSKGTNIYIAKMDSPVSITGPATMLTKPEYAWEKVKYDVNEAPAVLVKNGRVFLTYSASATDANYAMGMLTASADANLLDARSWTKSPEPVFKSSPANGQWGPGHNSFTTTPDGKTDILVYHARDYRDIVGDSLHDPNRHTRAQVITWRADGTPDFGEPVADAVR
jgi:GH43 family beta-xylosidase